MREGGARAASTHGGGRGGIANTRMTWARLLKRVFGIGVARCACEGKLKLVAVILQTAINHNDTK
ncbi:MAG: hypothetical protein EXR36_14145 [Betaproteobacteria bacterium]|nr:hypothetical protein [Betaproteobacteria bacterium]